MKKRSNGCDMVAKVIKHGKDFIFGKGKKIECPECGCETWPPNELCTRFVSHKEVYYFTSPTCSACGCTYEVGKITEKV